MYVVGFNGSPRVNGNTATVIRHVLKGAEDAGASTELIQIPGLSISGCQACRYCKEHDICRIDDDMQDLYSKIRAADAIIIGTPVYFADMTGQIKQFIDRWVALIDENFKSRISEGKKAGVIVTQGSPDTSQFKSVLPVFDFALTYLTFTVTDHLIIGGLFNPDEVLGRPDELQKAYQIGKTLVL
nr:flavodoxin family protein [uncultured Methanospirillum sp.]